VSRCGKNKEAGKMRGKLRLSFIVMFAGVFLLVTGGVTSLFALIMRGPSDMVDISGIVGILILVAGIILYAKGK
jgi:hypothetical protein